MRVTCHLVVASSWCWWAEPMWAELQRRYAGRAAFGWRIAKMDAADSPTSLAQYAWHLRRSAAVMGSDFVPSPDRHEYPPPGGYPAASAAARRLGATGDRVRTALSEAACRHGAKGGRLVVAVELAAGAGGLDADKLRALARSPEIAARLDETTAELHAPRGTQPPAFLLEDDTGARAVFSGLVRIEPLAAPLDAMLADAAGYAARRARHGDVPA